LDGVNVDETDVVVRELLHGAVRTMVWSVQENHPVRILLKVAALA
jgi:hypothetical protein